MPDPRKPNGWDERDYKLWSAIRQPLCEWHHQEGPDAIHKLGKKFWEHHGVDKERLIFTIQ